MKTILWIVHNMGWNDGALAALFSQRVLVKVGVHVAIQPLHPPVGPTLQESPRGESRTPWDRWRRRAAWPLDGLEHFDRVVIDQDAVPTIVRRPSKGDGAPFLFARHSAAPLRMVGADYTPFEGILTVNRSIYTALAAVPDVPASRLWPLPLLLDDSVESDHLPFPRGDRPTLVVAGVLDAAKGMDLVINALSWLAVVDKPWPLVVVGDGPDRRRLQQYAQALGVNAHFWTTPVGWGSVMRRGDLLLSLQFNEGLFFDAVWAARSGIPMLAHDLPGIREHIERGQALWVNEPSVMAVVEHLTATQWPARWTPDPKSLERILRPWIEALKL